MKSPAKVRLGSCVSLEKGKPPIAQPYFGPDADRYLTPEYLRTGGECALVKAVPCSARSEDGDTILLWDGANAGEVLYGRSGTLASTMSRASHDGRFDDSYFFFALKQWEPYLKGQTSGSGIPHIDKEILGNLTITCFNLKEQAKIAEVLSTVDRAIERTEALIAKQKRIKIGLMQDLLTCGIDEHGNLRSEQTHEFKDSPSGRIPMGWESAPLASFVPSAEYGISTSLSESGYPVLRMNNLLDGEVELSDLKFSDFPAPKKLWLRDGDVLFNRTNSWEHVGRSGIWRGQIECATFASYLVRLNPHPDKLLPEMLNFWLNWRRTQIEIRRQATPAVQQVNINPTNLRSTPAAFPRNLDEQIVITARISAVREVVNAVSEQLNKLKSVKAGLMKDLLTGDRRVTALLGKANQAMGT